MRVGVKSRARRLAPYASATIPIRFGRDPARRAAGGGRRGGCAARNRRQHAARRRFPSVRADTSADLREVACDLLRTRPRARTISRRRSGELVDLAGSRARPGTQQQAARRSARTRARPSVSARDAHLTANCAPTRSARVHLRIEAFRARRSIQANDPRAQPAAKSRGSPKEPGGGVDNVERCTNRTKVRPRVDR